MRLLTRCPTCKQELVAKVLSCPDCGKKISVFGESHIDEIAKELGTQVLGKMPIDPEFARMADGSFAQAVNPYIDDAVMALRRLK